jgi:hypothetical protein
MIHLMRAILGIKKKEIRTLNFIHKSNMITELDLNINLSNKVIPKYI